MSIATRIQSMYENVGEVYDTITNVTLPEHKNIENIPRTIRDSYLEIINNGINVIYDNWEKVTGEGTSLTLTPTEEAPMEIVYKGNTYQNGEPTPDTPIPIQVVSGDNTIKVEGKNLWSIGDISNIGWESGNNNLKTLLNSLKEGTYTITLNFKVITVVQTSSTNTYGLILQNSGGNLNNRISTGNVSVGDIVPYTYTITIDSSKVGNFTNCYLYGFGSDSLGATARSDAINNQLEIGSTATTYEPYTGASYPINLPVENLIQLNEINLSANTTTNLQLGANLPVGTYNFNGEDMVGDGRFNLYGVDLNNTQENLLTNELTKNIGEGYSFTTTKIYKAISLYTNVALSGKVQLEKGNKKNSFTPYGTNPIWLGWIETYQDKIDKSTGKNLIETDTISYSQSGTYNLTLGNDIEVGTYNLSGITSVSSGAFVLYGIDENDTQETLLANKNWSTLSTGYSFTTTKKYVSLKIYTNVSVNACLMLNEGTTALPYEPYGTSWYLKKEIGKVVLNGTEAWAYQSQYPRFMTTPPLVLTEPNRSQIYSNYFSYLPSGAANYGCFTAYGNLFIYKYDTTSTSDLQTWLSTHNTEVYYVLNTPTYTLIEGELLNQLEAIKMSYEGQTNLSQTNNDLAFILNPSALKKV